MKSIETKHYLNVFAEHAMSPLAPSPRSLTHTAAGLSWPSMTLDYLSFSSNAKLPFVNKEIAINHTWSQRFCRALNVAVSTTAAAPHTQLQVFTRTLKTCLISKTRTRRSSLIGRKKKKNISRRKAMWRQLYGWPVGRREPIIIRNNCNHTYS